MGFRIEFHSAKFPIVIVVEDAVLPMSLDIVKAKNRVRMLLEKPIVFKEPVYWQSVESGVY